MLGCKPIDTPMEVNKREGNLDEKMSVDMGRYQCLVGKLIYLSHTCPDIAFAVSRVSQHMHLPTKDHMEEVYRILRYLKLLIVRGCFLEKMKKEKSKFTQMLIGQGQKVIDVQLLGIVPMFGEI